MPHTILWRRHDCEGHESCRMEFSPQSIGINGVAVFAAGDQIADLYYWVHLNIETKTHTAYVGGHYGDRSISLTIQERAEKVWWLDNKIQEPAWGCVDLDLSFTPSTNLLAIRRLNLPIGGEGESVAAWLRFPEFDLAPLRQRYRRLDEFRYAYESDAGFSCQLTVDEQGIVQDYPPAWKLVAKHSAGEATVDWSESRRKVLAGA